MTHSIAHLKQSLIKFQRPEEKFDGIEQLINQMKFKKNIFDASDYFF